VRTCAAFLLLALAPGAAAAQTADEPSAPVRLLRDVALDYKNFLSIDSAKTLTIGGFAAGAVHAGDEAIAGWVQNGGGDATLTGGDTYGQQLVQLPLAFAWWTIASAAGSERHAATGRDLVRAQISVVSWTYAIKVATDRTRPNGDARSFPSGHASNSFATATVLQQHYGWKIGLPAFLLASYTGVSRITANQHWASDVVFGAAVGIASGRTATLQLRGARVTMAPLAVPGGGGVLVSTSR
jgi:membrane-associated phospholipid phosphatase